MLGRPQQRPKKRPERSEERAPLGRRTRGTRTAGPRAPLLPQRFAARCTARGRDHRDAAYRPTPMSRPRAGDSSATTQRPTRVPVTRSSLGRFHRPACRGPRSVGRGSAGVMSPTTSSYPLINPHPPKSAHANIEQVLPRRAASIANKNSRNVGACFLVLSHGPSGAQQFGQHFSRFCSRYPPRAAAAFVQHFLCTFQRVGIQGVVAGCPYPRRVALASHGAGPRGLG